MSDRDNGMTSVEVQIFRSVLIPYLALKQVVNTNKCLIHLEKHGEKLLIISCIDNLLKGASGQAVHNMNLMFNLGIRKSYPAVRPPVVAVC